MLSPIPKKRLTFINNDEYLNNIGTWIPEVSHLTIDDPPEDKGVKGKNNTDYVISDVKCVRLGHLYVTKDEKWDIIENNMKQIFSTNNSTCKRMTGNKNQHIDFIRHFKIGNQPCYQYLECKKTSGHSTSMPTMIKSSLKQLKALLEKKETKGLKMIPSLYIIVSVDFSSRHNSWVNTYWAMPVVKLDDFNVISTSDYRTFKPQPIPQDKHRLV